MHVAQKENNHNILCCNLHAEGEEKMKQIKPGAEVGIRCEIKEGPFSGEKLVSFDTVDGPITGFVREENLKETTDGWLVHAIVVGQVGDVVHVRVQGSFFTTNGLASIPREMALAA